MQNSVQQGNIQPVQNQPQYATQVVQPQPVISTPQVVTSPNPNYSGVNIQIFNPTVATPGSTSSSNINTPVYTNSCCGTGGAYPSNYYTQAMGQGVDPSAAAIKDYGNTAARNTTTNETIKETNNETTTNTKTEKRKVVQLTDEYIKNLENYLNSQDKEVRMMGAKEVVARLMEDDSRKNDKALTALINKMLQDPAHEIRMMALSMLDSRTVTGDDYTVGVLKKMESSKQSYGHDALDATQILLKMSGNTVEKEFEVKETTSKSKKE